MIDQVLHDEWPHCLDTIPRQPIVSVYQNYLIDMFVVGMIELNLSNCLNLE